MSDSNRYAIATIRNALAIADDLGAHHGPLYAAKHVLNGRGMFDDGLDWVREQLDRGEDTLTVLRAALAVLSGAP